LLENTRSIVINGIEYQLEYFLGGDYKMLRLLYGQKAANAAEACLYCRADLSQVPNVDAFWPISRTLRDIPDNNEPIVTFIEYKKCVIDLLHLLLRITDILYTLLLNKLSKMDRSNSIDLDLRPNLRKFCIFLRETCKLSNPYYVCKKTGLFKLRSFNGNERIKIFKKMFREQRRIKLQMQDLFPFPPNHRPRADSFDDYDFFFENFVWEEFFNIFKSLKKIEKEPIVLDDLKRKLKLWLNSYLVINKEYRNSDTIGPYLHNFCFHLPELIERHRNLNLFNTQGLEKLNHFCSNYYHSCTNKHNTAKKYLRQLITKRTRIEYIRLEFEEEEIIFTSDESESENEMEEE
jgi:hypothetical protein